MTASAGVALILTLFLREYSVEGKIKTVESGTSSTGDARNAGERTGTTEGKASTEEK